MTDLKKESLISKYKDPNMELEIRLKSESGELSREVFESVYNSLKASGDFAGPEITYTVNFVSKNVYSGSRNDDGNNIRSLVYDPAALPPPIDKPAVLLSESYYTKKFVESTPVRDYINYTINLNREIPSSKKFSTKADAEMRAKIRASFTDKSRKWRYDITATYQSKVNSFIKEVLNKFFIPLTADTFISNMNYEYVTKFEVEIEHIGQNKDELKVDDLSIARSLFGMINPEFAEKDEMQNEIANIAKFIVDNPKIHYLFKTRFGLKKLANQPIALTLETYSKIYPPIGYLATNKADGQRCIVSINGNRMRLLFGSMLEIYHPSKPKEILFEEDITILDAELITKTVGNVTEISLYLFDVMVFRDENISRLGYEERIGYLDDAVKYTSSFIHNNSTKTKDGKHSLTHISSKTIFPITTEPAMEKIFREIVTAKYPYENDGIVISAPGESYNSNIVYKWKPLENNTIDFLAMKVDKAALMSLTNPIALPAGHTLYYLFVGINHKVRQLLGINFIQGYKSIFPTISTTIDADITGGGGFHQQYGDMYYPIQFSPSFDPTAFVYFCPDKLKLDLNHKIVELRRPMIGDNSVSTEVGKWDMIKIREDRKFEQNYFGNDMVTAESIYQNYMIPFPLEHLWKPPLGYFQRQSDEIRDMWKTRNYFQRFVVGSLISKYAQSSHWIVDLASGRGADLKRYIDSGIKNAIFVDIDKIALSELVDRKLSMAQASRGDRKSSGMRVYTHAHDLKDKAETVMSHIEKFGFKKGEADFVMMNFAIHYLCDKTENIRNLAKLVNYVLKKGGVFVFTVMSGKSVFNAIKDINYSESLKFTENNVVKYEIKKLYKGTELSDVGQSIAVKLPFRDDLVEEPICNIDHVISVFEKKGFDLQDNSSFSDMLHMFEKSKRDEFHKLSEDDIMYSTLHNYVVLKKTSTMS